MILDTLTGSSCNSIAAVVCSVVDPRAVDYNDLPIIRLAMEHLVDHSTDSSAARPAQHPLIIRQYTFREAFAQCLSKHSPATSAHMQRVAEAFFQQLPATELTCAEVDLLNSLIHVAESVQAALPPSVSLQDWAQRRVPRGFERQVNSSGIVYVGGSILRTQLPLHKPAGSAAQPTSRSTATQPASVVEEFVFDDDGLYDFDLEAFFRQCPRMEITDREVDLLNSLIRVSASVEAVLPRSITLQEWTDRRVLRGRIVHGGGRFLQFIPLLRCRPRSASSAPQPASDSTAAQSTSVAQESAFPDDARSDPDLSQVLMQGITEPGSDAGHDRGSDEAVNSNIECWQCQRTGSTTRSCEVWWTTLLAPVASMPRRPMCSVVCLLEYLGDIYCPHRALETRLRGRMWAQLCKVLKEGANTTGESPGNADYRYAQQVMLNSLLPTKSDTSDRQSNSLSSAEQPASHSGGAKPLSVIPREALLPIVRFVGAHNLETIWSCSKCNPYWYDWFCDECLKDTGHTACFSSGRFERWSPGSHYGCCGDLCGCCRMCECCRSAKMDIFPCEFCENLRNLKRTCRTMQDLVKTYDAT